MKIKSGKKILALVMALSMGMETASLQSISLAAENEAVEAQAVEGTAAQTESYTRIEIKTAQDFADFTSKCYIDSWAKDKYIILMNDISLSEVEYETVPVFDGIFDGDGHTISGFDYIGSGYVVGLFRYIEAEGIVKNLNLKGNIGSENEQECVGSIAGINYGTIKNCTFIGTVTGHDTIGGIVGMNEETGTVSGCTSKGRVTGYYSTGGIVGINHGTVNNCTNNSGINDNEQWVETDDEMGGAEIVKNLVATDELEIYSGVDTGGIAGFSDGYINKCTNKAIVGYEHAGYNVGGIVGRQTGVVSLCTNNGTVYGRKDIGGIVGQMEPMIEVNEADSLRDAIDKLHDLVDKTLDDISATKNVVSDYIDVMQKYADSAIDSGDDLMGQLTDFVDDNIDETNTLASRFENVMDMLPEVIDNANNAGDKAKGLNSALKDLSDDLAVISKLKGSSYDGTEDKRVSVYSSVGGNATVDLDNPQTGETVTVTITPEEGYRLKSSKNNIITVTDAKGKKVTVTAVANNANMYTFIMPEENVKVVVEGFEYEGRFLVRSSVGGSVTQSVNGNAYTFTLSAQEGYQLPQSIKVDGIDKTLVNGAITLTKGVDFKLEGNPISVSAEFTQATGTTSTDTASTVRTYVSTGGAITVDNENPQKGDTVNVTVSPLENYVLTSLRLNGEELNDNSFVMPEGVAVIAAQFEPIEIIFSSNVGGNASYIGGQKNKIELTITPDAAYQVNAAPTVQDPSGKKVTLSKKLSTKTVYEFSVADNISGAYKAKITFKQQSEKQALDTAIDDVNSNLGNLSSQADKLMQSAGNITEALNSLKSSLSTSWTDFVTAWNGLNIITDLSNMSEALTSMSGSASTLLSSLATINQILTPYTSSTANAAKSGIEDANQEIENVINAIKNTAESVRSIVNYINGQEDSRFSDLGDDFDSTRELFHDQLKGLSDSIEGLNNDASSYSDLVNDDLKAVNDQLNVVFNLLADRVSDVEELKLDDFYEDVTDEDIDDITMGRVEYSTNEGVVEGDIDVGGIAGAMSIDEEDPEDNAAGLVDYKFGSSYILKCLIIGSTNDGYVTAKKDGAGGICGYMNHGIIVECEGYGSVDSTEGDYVGGICGQSLTIIKRCFSLCSVSGGQIVGGIAGYAKTLTDCYAMVDVTAQNGRCGAIAGQVKSYEDMGSQSQEDDNGSVINNFYVNDTLYGIDNISYVGVAEPISYQDLLTVENIPTEFWHLKVIYKIEDTYLGSEEVKYGESLEGLSYPTIPQKDGCYGVWPDVEGRVMNGTMVLEAEYKDDVTVVKSTGVEDEKALALIEDKFTEDTVLIAKKSDMTPPIGIEGKDYVIYDLSVEDGMAGDDSSFSVRLLNPYSSAVVYGYINGRWTQLESKVRGSYLQVAMTGAQQYFCIVDNKLDMTDIIVFAAGCIVVIILVIVLIKRCKANLKKKRNTSKQSKSDTKSDTKI